MAAPRKVARYTTPPLYLDQSRFRLSKAPCFRWPSWYSSLYLNSRVYSSFCRRLYRRDSERSSSPDSGRSKRRKPMNLSPRWFGSRSSVYGQ